MSDNLMNPSLAHRFRAAARCTATAKATGAKCNAPAVKGWRVCRSHGARGGAPPGKQHPNYRHGLRTRETIDMRQELAELLRSARDLCDKI